MNFRSKIGQRLLLLSGSLVCLSFALTIQVPPPEGYYITIYSHTPTLLWVAFGLSLVFLVISITVDGSRITHTSSVFTAIVVLLIAMPWLLDYYLYLTGDARIKVGAISSILRTSHIHPENFYPGLHTVAAIASQITGIQPAVITMPLLVAFAAATSIAGALLASQFTQSKHGEYIAVVVAPVLLIGFSYTNFAPWSQSKPILLFALFAIIRKSGNHRLADTGVTIFFIFAAIIYHPLAGVALLFILSISIFTSGMAWKFGRRLNLPISQLVPYWVLLAIALVAWTTSFNAFLKPVTRSLIINLLGSEVLTSAGGVYSSGGQSFIAQVMSQLQSASPRLGDLFLYGLFRYGFDGLMLLSAGIAVLLGVSKKRIQKMPQYYLLIVIPISAFGGLGIISIFLSLPIGFSRFISLATLFSAIAIAVESKRILSATSETIVWQSARVLAVFCVLIIILTIPFTIYGSTYAKSPNMQITKMEIEGTVWYLNHSVDDSEVVARGMQVRRYSMLLRGHQGMIHGSKLSPHFGYNSEGQNWYNKGAETTYLIVTEVGRIAYPKLYPGYQDEWDFRPSDFKRLQTDQNVAVVYTNGELSIYQESSPTQ